MASAIRPTRLAADEYRWSSAVRCPRWSVLERRNAEKRSRSTREERILARGRLFEDLVARQYVDEYGDENVISRLTGGQKEVGWPGGIMHVDVHVVTERASIEVKSSTAPESLLDLAFLQNAGQQLYDDECERGGVVLIDPVDLGQRYLPVNPTGALRENVEAIAEQLQWASETGGLPDCVCSSPTECRYRFCPYTDVAWEGWEALPPVELDDPEVQALAEQLYELKKGCREQEAEADQFRRGYKLVQAQLAERGIEPGRDHVINGFKLRRIVSKPRESFSVAKARAAGIWQPSDEDRFAGFVTVGDPSERWTVDRVAEQMPVDPYGEDVPF